MSPTERTLAALRKLGFTAQVVERWNPHAKVRQDLFGCIDIVAVNEHGILGVQACVAASLAARCTKSEAEPRLLTWLQGGGRFEVWAWKGPLLRREILARIPVGDKDGDGWYWERGEYETVEEMLSCAV